MPFPHIQPYFRMERRLARFQSDQFRHQKTCFCCIDTNAECSRLLQIAIQSEMTEDSQIPSARDRDQQGRDFPSNEDTFRPSELLDICQRSLIMPEIDFRQTDFRHDFYVCLGHGLNKQCTFFFFGNSKVLISNDLQPDATGMA